VGQLNNFENCLIFRKFIDTSRVSCFFWLTLYMWINLLYIYVIYVNCTREHHITTALPVNCISHSRTLSICIEVRSLRSSYSSFIASSVNENVARPREASRPAKTPYGPPETRNYWNFPIKTAIHMQIKTIQYWMPYFKH